MNLRRDESGAAMVEFALILPLLLLILFGIIDIGRLMLAEAMVTNGAREGARMKALGYSDADADTRVDGALPSISLLGDATASYTACPASPAPTDFATATVSTSAFTWLALDGVAALFGGSIPVTQPSSTATMRCLG